MSLTAANLRARLDRLEAAGRAPERQFTPLEISTRLAGILSSNDNVPRRRRIRELAVLARDRLALA